MAMMPGEESNPFRAPTATIGHQNLAGAAGADAELIRRTYIGHEASVRSIGSLLYLNTFFAGLGVIGYGLGAAGAYQFPNQNDAFDPRIGMAIAAMVSGVYLVVTGALGYGLRRLQVWSRWVTMVLAALVFLYFILVVGVLAFFMPQAGGFALIGFAVPGIIVAYVFYLMLSSKAAMVFSREYREVIRVTPDIKYKTSLVAKIALALIVALIAFAIIAAVVNGR